MPNAFISKTARDAIYQQSVIARVEAVQSAIL